MFLGKNFSLFIPFRLEDLVTAVELCLLPQK